MSTNKIRTLSLMQMDIHRGFMPIYQLATQLAESLKCLTALDDTALHEAIVEIQGLLPPSISVRKIDGNFQISITTSSSIENQMSIQNIINEEPFLPGLDSTVDHSRDDRPITPTDYHGYFDAIREEHFWDNFDIVDWPSWIDDDFPS